MYPRLIQYRSTRTIERRALRHTSCFYASIAYQLSHQSNNEKSFNHFRRIPQSQKILSNTFQTNYATSNPKMNVLTSSQPKDWNDNIDAYSALSEKSSHIKHEHEAHPAFSEQIESINKAIRQILTEQQRISNMVGNMTFNELSSSSTSVGSCPDTLQHDTTLANSCTTFT